MDEIEIEDWKPILPILNSEKEVNFDENFEIQLKEAENCENYQQMCHICNQFFVNHEEHFAYSHIKKENKINKLKRGGP